MARLVKRIKALAQGVVAKRRAKTRVWRYSWLAKPIVVGKIADVRRLDKFLKGGISRAEANELIAKFSELNKAGIRLLVARDLRWSVPRGNIYRDFKAIKDNILAAVRE